VIRLHPRRVVRAGGPGAAALALAVLATAGCAVLRREPLDVPPGHRLVGEVSLAGFAEPHVVLDIAREDGSYRHELPIDAARSAFVFTLPPGRYQVTRLRLNESGRPFSGEFAYPVRVEFEVGDSAVYVGTLQLERIAFRYELHVAVRDEYDRTVPALRGRHPELPPVVARGLMRPA
jgi:hypothetical protein